MADFDPFANQGGPAAWDPEHEDDSKKIADELLKNVEDEPDLEADRHSTGHPKDVPAEEFDES